MELNLWVLARRSVPLDVIKRKLDDYIAEGHIAAEEKDHYVEFFEDMQGVHREPNLNAALEGDEGAAKATDPDEENRQMSEAELRRELAARESQMQTFQGQTDVMTDQWRIYKEVIACLQAGSAPLRLCLQASAGTGKSFLLESVFLWAILNGHNREYSLMT